jgi:hypothetical protein
MGSPRSLQMYIYIKKIAIYRSFIKTPFFFFFFLVPLGPEGTKWERNLPPIVVSIVCFGI